MKKSNYICIVKGNAYDDSGQHIHKYGCNDANVPIRHNLSLWQLRTTRLSNTSPHKDKS